VIYIAGFEIIIFDIKYLKHTILDYQNGDFIWCFLSLVPWNCVCFRVFSVTLN